MGRGRDAHYCKEHSAAMRKLICRDKRGRFYIVFHVDHRTMVARRLIGAADRGQKCEKGKNRECVYADVRLIVIMFINRSSSENR